MDVCVAFLIPLSLLLLLPLLLFACLFHLVVCFFFSQYMLFLHFLLIPSKQSLPCYGQLIPLSGLLSALCGTSCFSDSATHSLPLRCAPHLALLPLSQHSNSPGMSCDGTQEGWGIPSSKTLFCFRLSTLLCSPEVGEDGVNVCGVDIYITNDFFVNVDYYCCNFRNSVVEEMVESYLSVFGFSIVGFW